MTFNIGQTGSTWKSISTTTTTGKIQYTGTDIKAVSVGSVYSMKCYSDRTEVYEDGTLIYTDNNAITTVKLQWGIGSNRSVTIKDFKIKAL